MTENGTHRIHCPNLLNFTLCSGFLRLLTFATPVTVDSNHPVRRIYHRAFWTFPLSLFFRLLVLSLFFFSFSSFDNRGMRRDRRQCVCRRGLSITACQHTRHESTNGDFKHCWQGNCTYICTGLRRTRLSVAARSRSVASRACVDRPSISPPPSLPTSARRRSLAVSHLSPFFPRAVSSVAPSLFPSLYLARAVYLALTRIAIPFPRLPPTNVPCRHPRSHGHARS